MKSEMNIKSIVIIAAVGIISLFFINMSLAANTAKINVKTANLRETADENAKILEQFSKNDEVEILEKQEDWYKVKAKGITGYIRQDLIVENEEPAQSNNTVPSTTNEKTDENQPIEETELGKQKVLEDTKLKIVPVINATDIIEVKKEQEVNVIETINGWACIEVETTKGWIRLEKLQKENDTADVPQEPQQQPESETKTLYVSASSVNLRKEASTNSEVVETLTTNTAVEVLAESNGWSQVKVGEKEGYISSTYLSENKQTTTSRSSGARRTTTAVETKTEEQQTAPVATSNKGAEVVAYAKQFIGTKYKYGGTSPSTGFDCSGFTSYVYKHFGVNLPRTSGGQSGVGTAVSRSNLEQGDLVIYSGHVAIYVGGSQVIHAPKPGKTVCIVSIDQAKPGSYQGARRVI